MPDAVPLAVLNNMIDRDFEVALDTHVAWGLPLLDLKEHIFGKGLLELTDAEARRAAEEAFRRGLEIYCLSSTLFAASVKEGESAFVERHLVKIDRLLQIAHVLKPRLVRLLSARIPAGTIPEGETSTAYLGREAPWLIEMYREAVDRIAEAGFQPVIENEIGGSIWRTPGDVVSFFDELDRGEKVKLTWDPANQWEDAGVFPTFEVYKRLKPLIGYLHLKGGIGDERGLQWASSMEDASWPLAEVATRAIADGVTEVLCLNPSHGTKKPGYDYDDILKRDIDYLRLAVPGVA